VKIEQNKKSFTHAAIAVNLSAFKILLEEDMIRDNEKMAVIFDLDGVIVDTGPFHKQSWYDLAEKYNFQMTDRLFYDTFGMQNHEIIPRLANDQVSEDRLKQMSDWKEQRYRQLIAGSVDPMDGVIELISDLKKSGFGLAIGTSAPKENLDLILENIDLRKYFDAYVIGPEVKNSKPAPDTFLLAAKKLSADASRSIVVEDALVGVKAAKAAKMKVVAVTTTTTREKLNSADLIVESLSELIAADFKDILKVPN
jgi:beta-phosphoglucomutase